MTNKTLKELLIAFSLANLLFAGSWRMYLYPPTFEYHIKTGPGRMDYLGIILAVSLTAVLFSGLLWLFQRFYKEKASLLINLTFVTCFLFALNICRLQLTYSAWTLTIAIVSQVIFFLVMAATLTRWRGRIFDFAKKAVFALSPFVLITFSQAAWKIINYHEPTAEIEPPIAEQLAAVPSKSKESIKNRVVWIIFDEFDYRLAFDLKAVELPEFEHLKAISLSATNAQSPANDTLEAIPSLLTGKNIKKGVPQGRSELILNFADGSSGKFSETPSVFSEVKALSGHTAVNGFYHSYCRVIGQQLSVCKWLDEDYIPHETLAASFFDGFAVLYSQLVLAFTLDSELLKQTFDANLVDDKWHIREMIENRPERLAGVYQIAADPKIDLAFIHLPIPHPPSRFDRRTGGYNPQTQDYVDNLVLADLVLGEIRRAMEDNNQWDNSTVIVSSDHPLRVKMWMNSKYDFTVQDKSLTAGIEDSRIPFFLKMRGQNEPFSFDAPFNTLISHDLILALMKGEIDTPEEARGWLEKHRP